MIFTEYDPLEEVIVADTYLPGDIDELFPGQNLSSFNQILQETKEDFDRLADFLSQGNIKVHRPDVYAYKKSISFPNFNVAFPMSPVVPRDQYKVLGTTILQTYTSLTDRYFDGLSYYTIFQQLFDQGYNWISQPAPVLKDLNTSESWFVDGGNTYKKTLADKILWHTATMHVVGDAIIVNNSGPGTQRGLEWIKRNLPDYTIINNNYTKMNNFGHIDHGYFMVDDDTVVHNGIEWVPNVLKNKKLIDISKVLPKNNYTKYRNDYANAQSKFDINWMDQYLENWRGYVQETCFELNVLVIDRHNVVFSRAMPEMFALLKTHQIDCHVIEQRHALYWDGGIHCATLDLKRRGEKRSIVKPPKTFDSL
jgi:glycine amidinotransferase